MTSGKRRGALGIALGATLLATYFAPPSADDGVVLNGRTGLQTDRSGPDKVPAHKPIAAITDALSVGSTTKSLDVLSIRRRDGEAEPEVNVFVTPPPALTPPPAPQITVPNVPVAAILPPQTPQAPPLPFRVIGRYIEDGRIAVFLQHNDQNLVVRAGEVIDEQYKAESLSGTTLTLRYKPLDQLQTLDIGTPN